MPSAVTGECDNVVGVHQIDGISTLTRWPSRGSRALPFRGECIKVPWNSETKIPFFVIPLFFDPTMHVIIFTPSRTYPHEGSCRVSDRIVFLSQNIPVNAIQAGSQVVSSKDLVFTRLQAMPEMSQKE